MERNYRLVVFDWDGTLMDSAGAIVACMQAAASDLGLPPPDDATARQVIGLGLHDALSCPVPCRACPKANTAGLRNATGTISCPRTMS
jgi:phosphoglycolate phosphatase